VKGKTVSLVLSSGGARGMAHIGVIEAIEAAGLEIVSIAGCSAGALVGGLHAAGRLSEFKQWITDLDKVDVFSLMDFTFSKSGFIKGEKVFAQLGQILGDVSIEDLRIPFACTAVQIPDAKECVFTEGPLLEAIRASASIPSALIPACINDTLYVDGGITNPIPFSLLENMPKGDITLAVDLNGPESELAQIELPEEKQDSKESALPEWLSSYKEKLDTYLNSSNGDKEERGPMSSVELLNFSFDLLQDRLTSMVLEKRSPDILVRIARQQCGTLEFYKAAELIEIGRKKANTALGRPSA